MGVGDVRNPCKCAGCSLQKGALNAGLFNMLPHIVFVTVFVLYIGIDLINKDYQLWIRHYLQIDIVGKILLQCILPSHFYDDDHKNEHNKDGIKESILIKIDREKLILKIFIVIQYVVLPFIAHYVLIHGALARSYCCCFVWTIYTFLYILADIIYKGYNCEWSALFYLPNWLLQLYYAWIVVQFKEEIVLYGKIQLPLRVARCPYYFKPPPGYDPRQDFLPSPDGKVQPDEDEDSD